VAVCRTVNYSPSGATLKEALIFFSESSMSNAKTPDSQAVPETTESFNDILSEFEREHRRAPQQQMEGTVISVTPENVVLDFGYKTEGILPITDFVNEEVKAGDKIPVTVKGRDPEGGFYLLSRFKVARPTDWSALEKAFEEKSTIIGTVTGVVKGGVSVDIGVRAFMPASRTGTRDAAELEKLVEQEIRCRIIKLDVADEDVVVDRRIVLEEEEKAVRERRMAELKIGDTLTGTVRSLTDYGAFIDLGGFDGLLHVAEIAWSRVTKPSDVLSVGEEVQVRLIKVEPESNRISLSLRQLQANPWDTITEKYKLGQRVSGTVTRVADFGAFVELEPGVEGLIHVSEMSWGKKIKIASDFIKVGENVETEILKLDAAEKRISLGLKQTKGDPWANAAERFREGTVVEGPITRFAPFGAFLQIEEGVEGLIHVSEISPDKRVNHPQDELKVGQVVKAQVLAVDPAKRQLKLSIKQLAPTSLDDFFAENHEGEVVTGRILDVTGDRATVELGEGVRGTCILTSAPVANTEAAPSAKLDLSSLSSMLNARWKGTASSSAGSQAPQLQTGQVRSFRISRMDASNKSIDLKLAD
jgi:small subunit ribosomal protein S1